MIGGGWNVCLQSKSQQASAVDTSRKQEAGANSAGTSELSGLHHLDWMQEGCPEMQNYGPVPEHARFSLVVAVTEAHHDITLEVRQHQPLKGSQRRLQDAGNVNE